MLLLDENKLERRTLARNELLFRQGDKVRAIYFIEEGRLRLDRRTFDGRSLVFGASSAGEFFVEAALFAEIFHCDAVATEPSRVRVYPKTAVLKAFETEPSSALPFLKLIAHQLIEARHRLELTKIRSAKERVLLYIDLHAATDGTVMVKGNLQDVAGELGLTREAFYRTIASLERVGAIKRSGTRTVLKKKISQ
jgi:CRP/FNR family transcriptional regulator, dissimilatory nitrate respiration regulator